MSAQSPDNDAGLSVESAEYRVRWLDLDGNPVDQSAEGEYESFPTLDDALEWDPENCVEFLTWVEVRPVVPWSTDLSTPPGQTTPIPPASTDGGAA